MAAVLLIAAALTAASGAKPSPNTLLGGGALGQARAHYTTIRVARDGRSVHFYGDWRAVCPGHGPAIVNVDGTAALKPDGTFSGSGTRARQPFAGSVRLSFAGRFTSPASAAGSGRVTFALTGSKPKVVCESGRVAFQVRTSPAVAAAGPPRGGAAYFGNTSKSFPFLLRVSVDAAHVLRAAAELNLTCTSIAAGLFYPAFAPSAPIGNGRFSSVRTYDDSELFGEGKVGRVTSVLRGSFARGAASGIWRIAAKVLDTNTGTVDGTCTSGTVRWAAAL
jgi:hypothetical protein